VSARRASRVTFSAAGLAAAVGAVPALLIGLVGNPLPSRLPAWAQVQVALAEGWKPSDRFVIGVLSVVLWVLWARLMGHLYAEVAAHRATLHVGADDRAAAAAVERTRRGLSRRLAGWLIGGLMAAGPLLPTAGFAAPAPLPAVLVATHATAGPGPPGPGAPMTPAATPEVQAPVAALPEYVVHTWAGSKDCLWNIAERFLGDPVRWHEIEDLNRHLAQPSGRTLGADPRHWVYPGMVLRLPADATGPGLNPTAPPPAASTPASTPPSTPSEQDRAKGAAPQPLVAPGEVEAPVPTTAATPTTAAPAAPAVTPSGPPPTVPPSTAPPVGRPEPAAGKPAGPTATRSARRSDSLPVTPVFGVGGVVIAAGIAAEVRRRRRRQLSRRRPDQRLPHLTEPAAAAARAVAAAPIEDVDWLAAELRLLVRGLSGPARARFEPIVVQYQGQVRIEVALARSCGTPPGRWGGAAGSKVWTLEAPHSPEELAEVDELPPCLPLLVSLGDQDEHGQVMLNLEASSAVGIVGERGMVEALVRSVLWELATSPLAEQLSLVTLGVAEPASEQLSRWRPAGDTADLAATLRRDSTAVARALGDSGLPSLPAARAAGEDPWAPTVAVVTSDAVTPEVLQAASGPGVVVIVAGGCPADALEVQVVGGEVAVPSIGLICAAQQLTRPATEDLDRLLVEVTAEPVTAPADEPHLTDPVAPPAPPASAATNGNGTNGNGTNGSGTNGSGHVAADVAEDPDAVELATPWFPPAPRVLVRLLGPPAVEGALKPLSAQQLSGLAFLATHRPTTKSQVMEALWGDKPPGERRWRDFLSELRATIPDGITIVPPVTEGVVAATDDLGSDVGQLEAFLARAAAHPKERVRCLEGAVSLLRGVPFAVADPRARRYWRWVEMDYIDGRVFQQLAQAGHDLARIYLDAGNAEAAMGVAHKLLGACSLDPGLTEVLMEAYAAMGSVGAAERVFEAHDAALVDACGYEGASEQTRLVLDRIRRAEPTATGSGRPLSVVRK